MSYPGDSALASDVQQRILTTFQQTLTLVSKGQRQEALLGCDFILRLDPQFGPARTLQQMVNAGRSGPELAELFGGGGAAAAPADAAEQARQEATPYVRAFLDSARQALAFGDSAEAERLVRKAQALDAGHPEIAKFQSERGTGAPPAIAALSGSQGFAADSDMASLELPEVDMSPASEESLFGEAAGGGENAGRIQELLGEGQRAFERGEFQGAIDAWSRIFLIDIDHHEAARRIEEARRLKAERERETEELFHSGVAQFDAADFASAERSFQRVLEIAPAYVMAQEYLEKIAERRSGAPAVAPAGAAAGAAPRPREAGAPESARAGGRPARDSAGEILVPPDPGASRARSRGAAVERPGYGVAKKKKAMPSSSFLAIGGTVLVLLLVGGWLLLRNRASLFPNAREAATTPAPSNSDPIARAKALHAEGKTAIALAQLRRLPPQDASFAEAQSLITQWEALVKPAEPVPAGLPPLVKAKRDGYLADAERACREGENLRCRRLLEKAGAIQPLEASGAALLSGATQALTPLQGELQMFADGEYESALNRLWRIKEAEPGNRDVRQLIVDSYFNLGVLELQRGDPAAAADRFREAKALDGADAELDRMESFAITYTSRADDLLYQIFVRNVANR